MKMLHIISFSLIIIGAVNLGLIGLLNLDIIKSIFGSMGLENIINILIGASAVVVIVGHKKDCKACAGK